MAKRKTRLEELYRRQRKVERDLAVYERKVTLYFNKRKTAMGKLRYYDRQIRAELAPNSTKDPTRIVEV